jgi:hypothetical protein
MAGRPSTSCSRRAASECYEGPTVRTDCLIHPAYAPGDPYDVRAVVCSSRASVSARAGDVRSRARIPRASPSGLPASVDRPKATRPRPCPRRAKPRSSTTPKLFQASAASAQSLAASWLSPRASATAAGVARRPWGHRGRRPPPPTPSTGRGTRRSAESLMPSDRVGILKAPLPVFTSTNAGLAPPLPGSTPYQWLGPFRSRQVAAPEGQVDRR